MDIQDEEDAVAEVIEVAEATTANRGTGVHRIMRISIAASQISTVILTAGATMSQRTAREKHKDTTTQQRGQIASEVQMLFVKQSKMNDGGRQNWEYRIN